MTIHLRGFLDRYRALLMIFSMLLCAAGAQAQYLQPIPNYGYQWKRGKFDSLWVGPQDTFAVPSSLQNVPWEARKGAKKFRWSTSLLKWEEDGGSTYTFTGPLSESSGTVSIAQAGASTDGYLSAADYQRFFAKTDSIKVRNDSLFEYKSGTEYARGKVSASIDSFLYATRRYVDSSTAVFGSRLYDSYNTHDTLTQSRNIDLNDIYGLTFTVDGTNDLATGINASGFTTKRSKHDFTANNGWIYGQLHDPAQVYKTRFQVIGLVNDSTHSAQLISTNNNNYNKKAALVSAAWWEGVKLQANVNWTTSASTSGYKGIYVYSTAGDGTGQVKIDREMLSVGASTDSALVRKSDGTIGLYPVSGGGGASTTLSTLTYGATTTWNYATQGTAAKVTLTGNTTLSITNLPASVVYLSLTVIQDATGSRTITLPAGTKVISGGAGAVTLTTTGGASDKLTFEWDGTTLWCNYGLNYN